MLKFSIIIPTYNDSERLPRAIKSVINQTVLNWELIVVDDGSKDDTETVIQEFFEDQRIQYIKKENAGVAAARNTGFQISEGDYLVFLDSDDEVQPTLLEDYKYLIANNSNIGFTSCGMLMNGKQRLPKIQKGISDFKYSVIPGSFCIKAIVFESIGTYDENLKQGENWEMAARALAFCKNNDLQILHIDKCNLFYHHFKTEENVALRDLHRAKAHEYLAEKYSNGGVLYFKKCDFLLTAAVNYTRAKKFRKARSFFLQNFKCNPGFSGLLRMIIFEIPFLRKRKWIRS